MTSLSGATEAYWREVGEQSNSILSGQKVSKNGLVLRGATRADFWESPNFPVVGLYERITRLFGRKIIHEARVLMCSSPAREPVLDKPWVSRELHFDPVEGNLIVRISDYVPSETDEDTFNRARQKYDMYAQEDEAGLTVPDESDYRTLISELRGRVSGLWAEV